MSDKGNSGRLRFPELRKLPSAWLKSAKSGPTIIRNGSSHQSSTSTVQKHSPAIGALNFPGGLKKSVIAGNVITGSKIQLNVGGSVEDNMIDLKIEQNQTGISQNANSKMKRNKIKIRPR